MKIVKITIENFRGIKDGLVLFTGHNVLVGDNNTGKSSVLEAIDLVLGPERLNRYPVIDEHDFYAGEYLDENENPIPIKIELIIIDLNAEQLSHFNEHIEWWDLKACEILELPPPERTDSKVVIPCLRLGFKGAYDSEEDNFIANTFFASPTMEDSDFVSFKTSDKRRCGFLYLRTMRTGSRALSFERGSLLDIILKLQDTRLKMWEDVLNELRELPVAEDKDLGITDILKAVQESLLSYLPSDGAENPHIRVSDLTRENLRKTLTVFMDTGAIRNDGSVYAAPFQHQGTGTINVLVLSLLSIIADLKQNVIFAMEEPEIAIPPHTQKSVIEGIRSKSSQAIFTSHSPYVLEEFKPSEILVLKKESGFLNANQADYPPTVKPKAYKEEFRKRFCESLLSRRILITEGRTEYDAYPGAAKRLHELAPDRFKTLESMGLSILNAETDSQIAPLGEHFNNLGKITFTVCDKQDEPQKGLIQKAIDHVFEAPDKNCEALILNGIAETALRKYALGIVSDGQWPVDMAAETPTEATSLVDLKTVLKKYLKRKKGSGAIGDLLEICAISEMPTFIVATLEAIQDIIFPEIHVASPVSPIEVK